LNRRAASSITNFAPNFSNRTFRWISGVMNRVVTFVDVQLCLIELQFVLIELKLFSIYMGVAGIDIG
jgi:hypothetical protein